MTSDKNTFKWIQTVHTMLA